MSPSTVSLPFQGISLGGLESVIYGFCSLSGSDTLQTDRVGRLVLVRCDTLIDHDRDWRFNRSGRELVVCQTVRTDRSASVVRPRTGASRGRGCAGRPT